jgi:hypothetical protein
VGNDETKEKSADGLRPSKATERTLVVSDFGLHQGIALAIPKAFEVNAPLGRGTNIKVRPEKRKRPDSVKSHGTLVEQPSPEVCSQPLYVLIAAGGMARRGGSYRTIW